MATYEQLLEAAGRAHKAGDEKNARILVQEAKRLKSAKPTEVIAQTPPRADAPGAVSAPRPDNFGDTIAAATEEPRGALSAFAGGLADQSRSPTMAALPESMDPRLKGMVAGVGDLAGVGISTLGVGVGAVAGLVGETFGGSPTNEMKLARDLTMMGQVAVPELAGVSSAARAAGAVGAKAPTVAQQSARAAQDLGITPALGMGGKTAAMTAAGLEKIPLTGGVIAADAARAVGEVEGAFNRAVSLIGVPGGAVRAGEKLQAGLGKFVEGFKASSGELYAAVTQAIPGKTMIQAPETVKAIREALAPFEGNPEIAAQLGLGKWASMADGLDRGLSWKAVSDLRSKIGESIGKINGPLADMDQGRLKQVYGMLTADMEAAARAAGPEAYRAWKRATQHYKAGAERIESALDKTISANSPERAFEAFTAAAKADRATSDITRLRRIKASMPKDDWNDVTASIVDRLGRSPAGQQGAAGDTFSPSVFLTEWNKMAPDAKKLLLPEDARIELEKLAKVAERVKAGNLERNMSNTGTAVGWLGVVFGSAADVGTTAAAVGGSYLSAKALTSPVFLRAMNRAAAGDTGAIVALAKGKGAFAQDARTIMLITGADAAAGEAANSSTAPVLRAVK